MNLKGKKILYIGVSTFNYEQEIKLGLERLGASVDYYDERPANDFLTKVFLRLNLKTLIHSKIDKHYSNILNKSKNIKYDYVFIIKLETIDKNILEHLKENQKNATFILYLWDSIQNYKGKEKLLPLFDKAFSFDKTDTIKYNTLNFLPLFYIPLYEIKPVKENSIEYDLCFFGTGHSDRYKIVKEIKKKTTKMNLKVYSFFYLQNKIIFWGRKLFDKKMQNAKISDFSFNSLTQNQLLDKILKSNVIIDIEHEGQVGLTMRTIEALGCHKKLLTSNKSIKDYDFYNENNICIIDRKNIKVEEDFFKKSYEELDKEIYSKYTLSNWLKTIFGDK